VRSRAIELGVVSSWALLALVAGAAGDALDVSWPHWQFAFFAAAVWGLNLLILRRGVGAPFGLSRIPVLAVLFAFLMTALGTGSYWATTQLFPAYRVNIERAMMFVALCTSVMLCALTLTLRMLRSLPEKRHPPLEWGWPRLRAVTYMVTALAVAATVVTIRRIGYVPLLSGDPANVRFEFPEIGGVWYRLSVLAGVSALLAGVQAAGRRATWGVYIAGLVSLLVLGVYSARFLAAFPLGVALLMWDRFRQPLSVRKMILLFGLAIPIVPLAGYWRQGFPTRGALGPAGLILFNTFLEFRDLGWALEFYGTSDQQVRGATLGSIVVPVLPSAVWRLVGVDKQAIYSEDSATLIAAAMGQSVPQRIGAYGEFYMNFGFAGAIIGAVLYGVLLGYLDRQFQRASVDQVRALMVGLAAAAAVFAQIGQLNMFTSTITGLGYPILLVTLVASHRPAG